MATLEIQETISFEVIVTPKAARERIGKIHDGALKLYVTVPPEKGKANSAVVSLLARTLDIPLADVKLLSGATSRRKTVAIEGVSKLSFLKAIGESNES